MLKAQPKSRKLKKNNKISIPKERGLIMAVSAQKLDAWNFTVNVLPMEGENAMAIVFVLVVETDLETINRSALTPIRKCKCKKSMCQEKYCECFSSGLECTEYC